MTRRSLLLVTFIGLTGIFAMAIDDSGVARMSYLEGRVSFQHAGDVDWSAASINMALQPADRIYTGEGGRAEIQFDEGSVLRLAEKTDVEILTLKEEFIQIRILAGLATLNVHNRVHFEINTPAAAFNTTRTGVYRFWVDENGDTDGIVRKGLLDAASNRISKRLESGDLIHIAAGDNSTYTLSRYLKRDEWDEWNDRRNADMVAYESKKYLPDNIYSGARELDRYGRWVEVRDYGPAWVPLYVDSAWSPYWNGRWCYRPRWGWTWTSYEPWGWLPYHYGRWSFGLGIGWHWLPGPSYGFHFWSPGLVRFFRGPNWVSWCPLGPEDYYDTNQYFYRSPYSLYLNNLRLQQRRGPEDLVNQNIPGAFRTAHTDQFANESLGRGARSIPVPDVDQPWLRGRMVTDQIGIQPTGRSLSPAPDRPVVRPVAIDSRPAIVRTEPAPSDTPHRYSRITTPEITPVPPLIRLQERGIEGGARTYVGDGRTGSSLTRRPDQPAGESGSSQPSIWNRRATDTIDSRQRSRVSPSTATDDTNDTGLRNRSRDFPVIQGTRPGYMSPNRLDPPVVSPGNRYERSVPESRQPQGERPRSEFRLRTEPSDASPNYVPRYSLPRYEPRSNSGRSTVPSEGGSGDRSYGRVMPAPSMGGGRGFGESSPSRSTPQVRSAPQGGSDGGPSMQRRRDN